MNSSYVRGCIAVSPWYGMSAKASQAVSQTPWARSGCSASELSVSASGGCTSGRGQLASVSCREGARDDRERVFDGEALTIRVVCERDHLQLRAAEFAGVGGDALVQGATGALMSGCGNDEQRGRRRTRLFDTYSGRHAAAGEADRLTADKLPSESLWSPWRASVRSFLARPSTSGILPTRSSPRSWYPTRRRSPRSSSALLRTLSG